MESKERKSELQRHRLILLATIDYIMENIAAEDLTNDDFEVVSGYYRRQKYMVEKNFELARLYNLQQQLNKLTEFPTHRCDLRYNAYIKKKTGFNIDIFENLRIRTEGIIAKNKINNKEQLNDIVIALNLYKQQSVEQEKLDKLKNLISSYFDKKIKT